MREVEYYISKDSCGKEYKTKTTTICGFDEIKKEIEENECLHDWSLEYVAYDGTTGQITAQRYFTFLLPVYRRFPLILMFWFGGSWRLKW